MMGRICDLWLYESSLSFMFCRSGTDDTRWSSSRACVFCTCLWLILIHMFFPQCVPFHLVSRCVNARTLSWWCGAVLQCRRRLLTSCRRTTRPSRKETSSSSSAMSPASRDRMSRGTVVRLSPTRWRNPKVRCVRFGVRGKVLHNRQLTIGQLARRCTLLS